MQNYSKEDPIDLLSQIQTKKGEQSIQELFFFVSYPVSEAYIGAPIKSRSYTVGSFGVATSQNQLDSS